jgi:hypothetical protein
MASVYGREAARPAGDPQPEPPPARWVVLVDSASAARRIARVLLESRQEVAQFDAGSPEILLMTEGLEPARGAAGPEWDAALAGHSAEERDGAEIFALDV